MSTLEKMIDGFKLYKATSFGQQREIIRHKQQAGMQPSSMVITSSDLPISIQTLTGSMPGDLYEIRNKGGWVPPMGHSNPSSFAATLEHAIVNLGVQNILVLGHSHNSALKMLLDGGFTTTDSDPMRAWLGIAHPVYEAVRGTMAEYPREVQERAMELETIVMGMRNLFSYPWIEQRVQDGSLEIYGWHFDLDTGDMLGYMPNSGQFESFA